MDHLNLEIKEGEFFGFLGPNGAGKTTTVRMISTITTKDSGDIVVDGDSVDRNLTSVKAKIGVVPQMNNLEPEMSAWENLEVIGILYGLSKEKRRKRIEELLAFIELSDRQDDLAKTYSGGMKRKLMIARALMHEPKLLLLDEPTVGLDAGARRKMWDLLKNLKSNGLTVLLTTHYIEEAEILCDRVGLINQGKLVQIDTPQNLIDEVGKITVEYFEDGKTQDIFFDSRDQAANYAKGIKTDVKIRASNLEDVFLKLTNRRVES
ncbi:MAG: type transport system ATP-binding protein [Eubacteriaceae bacterium]|nr:type transport system ATP-binding protein [Eubacteriaceae bacterium]